MGESEGGRQGGAFRRIAVTGCAGFIGSRIVLALAEAGHGVKGIVEPGDASGPSGVPLHAVDIRTGDGLAAAFSGADAVIHLAARNHILRETAKDPLSEYRRVNVDGTRNVARAAREQGVRLFIHVSSIKAMGEGTGEILDETTPCRPSTPYGISKLESEEGVRAEADGTRMAAVIFRLPMVYGPGNKGNLPRMIRWADRGLPFPLVQPDNLRSMVYVGNVVAAVKAVLDAQPAGGAAPRTYIVKDDADCSTRMIYSSICRELGKAPRFIPLPAAFGWIAGVVSEDFRKVTSSFRVSSAKIHEEIGFVPPISGEDGIARTVRWYRRSVR
jgi:nucleoside-diphosphate-sugar epimerase